MWQLPARSDTAVCGEHTQFVISCSQRPGSTQCAYGNLHACHCLPWLCLTQRCKNNSINNRRGHVRHWYIMQSCDRGNRDLHTSENTQWKKLPLKVRGGRGWEGRACHMCKPSRPGDDVTSPVGWERYLEEMVLASSFSIHSASSLRGPLFSLVYRRLHLKRATGIIQAGQRFGGL